MNVEVFCFDAVAPVRERGLKLDGNQYIDHKGDVAPVRERGLKYFDATDTLLSGGRSREGAWIEIRQWAVRCMHEAVAPVRERGLKYCNC